MCLIDDTDNGRQCNESLCGRVARVFGRMSGEVTGGNTESQGIIHGRIYS